ncbi:MAG TPA: LysR substrate-binding domain-containing protein [Deferrisomatales bacterium]|nr:LysR substrate-binding domain-containing protein [Deferrisomatales bacterium]
MNLPTDLLRTFLAIADTHSFTRAAETVHRTQSAVSMQMRRLEEDVDRPLFHRSGRSVTLTADGETLLGYARRMLRLNDEAVAAIRRPEVSGVVRLGSPDDFVGRYLPGILARFARTYPGVRVEMICEPTEYLIGMLKRGEVDLAINSRVTPGEGEQVLRREPTLWVASAQHFAHEQDPVPLALFQEGCFFRGWAFRALDEANRSYRVAFASPSISGIHAAVSAGLAVTLLAQSVVPPEWRVLGPAEGFPQTPSVSLVLARPPVPGNAAVDCLAQYVAEGFRDAQPVEQVVGF